MDDEPRLSLREQLHEDLDLSTDEDTDTEEEGRITPAIRSVLESTTLTEQRMSATLAQLATSTATVASGPADPHELTHDIRPARRHQGYKADLKLIERALDGASGHAKLMRAITLYSIIRERMLATIDQLPISEVGQRLRLGRGALDAEHRTQQRLKKATRADLVGSGAEEIFLNTAYLATTKVQNRMAQLMRFNTRLTYDSCASPTSMMGITLLDSGASNNFISKEMADALKIKARPSSTSIVVADGSAHSSLGQATFTVTFRGLRDKDGTPRSWEQKITAEVLDFPAARTGFGVIVGKGQLEKWESELTDFRVSFLHNSFSFKQNNRPDAPGLEFYDRCSTGLPGEETLSSAQFFEEATELLDDGSGQTRTWKEGAECLLMHVRQGGEDNLKFSRPISLVHSTWGESRRDGASGPEEPTRGSSKKRRKVAALAKKKKDDAPQNDQKEEIDPTQLDMLGEVLGDDQLAVYIEDHETMTKSTEGEKKDEGTLEKEWMKVYLDDIPEVYQKDRQEVVRMLARAEPRYAPNIIGFLKKYKKLFLAPDGGGARDSAFGRG